MYSELDSSKHYQALPVFHGYLVEPMLYGVLEGRRPGRVWVDDPAHPTAALVWAGTECAYVAGREDDPRWRRAVRDLVHDEVIPVVAASGGDMVSLFSFPGTYPGVLVEAFARQMAQATPVELFRFGAAAFHERRRAGLAVPDGLALRELDSAVLAHGVNSHLAGEVVFYWGSVDVFLAQSYGYGLLEGDRVVSYCYCEAYGGRTRAMTVWTAPDYRERGLATLASTAFVARCLAEGDEPYWMCDQGNAESRRLAERLGFDYHEDILVVDVPFHPFEFYRGLARDFFMPHEAYRRAAEAYERAFAVRDAEAGDYYSAAVAWAYHGNGNRALMNLGRAVAHGWQDAAALDTDEAFHALRETPGWHKLMRRFYSGARGN